MGSEVQGPTGPCVPREIDQQCLVREGNEAAELLNTALESGADRQALRCECGDPACRVSIAVAHEEYESVRGYGSHFFISPNHENPENSWVLSENGRFAVIDIVGGEARYQVLAQNPRHEWVEARDGRT